MDELVVARCLCKSVELRQCWEPCVSSTRKGWRQPPARYRRSPQILDSGIFSQCLSPGLCAFLDSSGAPLLELGWLACTSGHLLERMHKDAYVCTCSICQQKLSGDIAWNCGACDYSVCGKCSLIGSLKRSRCSSRDTSATQVGESGGPESSLQRIAIVVRIHSGTTKAMMERHVGWAASLAASSEGSRIKVWILVDETFGVNTARQYLQELALQAGLNDSNLGVIPYTESDMEVISPTMTSLRAAIPRTKDVEDSFSLPHKKSLAWGFHVEAILIWWVLAGRYAGGLSHIWVLEDDAGFSGEILSFLKAYRSDFSADLLTHGLQGVSPRWIWSDVATPKFLKGCPEHVRFRCAEHVQRFSARLLDKLLEYCWEGISGWSEMSVPTLCYKAGFDLAPLQDRHIGQVFAYNGKVACEHWDAICTNPFTSGRWWHALKW